MAAITFDKERVLAAIDAVVHQTMNMDMTWDWPCGVAYFGICEAYRATGKQEYLDLMKARVDEYIELGLPNWTVNTCSMGHAMLTLHEVTGDEKYKKIAESKIDYLRNTALRFGDSVLQHTVSAKNDFPEQCWADTLFMAAFFMLRAGVAWNDASLIDDALNQYYWHIEYIVRDIIQKVYFVSRIIHTSSRPDIPVSTQKPLLLYQWQCLQVCKV